MRKARIEFICRDLWAQRAEGLHQLRIHALRHGPVAPVGEGNRKTDLPGTYRPVGVTCPSSCPALGKFCYAQGGHVGMIQRRSSDEADAAVMAAIVAITSALKRGTVARLHVSGDFAREDKVDMAYVNAISAACSELRALSGQDIVAYTYTHLHDGKWVQRLRDSGCAVRMSDSRSPNGAIIVRDREHAREVRQLEFEPAGTKLAVCPAQLGDITCRACKLCWERPDITIAFLPEGVNKAETRRSV